MAITGLKVDKNFRKAVKESEKPVKREKKVFTGTADEFYKLLKLKSEDNFEIYVPNLTTEEEAYDEEGNPILDADGEPVMNEVMAIDNYRVHTVYGLDKNGKRRFKGSYRCIHNIKYGEKLDGTCPLCDAYYQIETKWVREKAEQEARKQGISLDDEKAIKAIKTKLWKESFISQTSDKVALPVFVIRTQMAKNPKTGKMKPAPIMMKDEDGNPVTLENGKPMCEYEAYFFLLSKSRYQKKFCDSVAAATDDEVLIPAGRRFKVKAGKSKDAMTVAKDTEITHIGLPVASQQYIYEEFDRIASEKFTDTDAMNNILEAQINSKADLEKFVLENEAPKQKEIDMLVAQKTVEVDKEQEADVEVDDLLADVEAE